MDIADVLAFISEATYADLMRVSGAVDNRRPHVHAPKLTATDVKRLFAIGNTVELFNLTNKSLNGQRGTVTGIQRTTLDVNIGGAKVRIPAEAAIVIEGPATPAASMPELILTSTFVQVTNESKKYAGRIGVVVGVGKSGMLNVALQGGDSVKFDSGLLKKLPQPEPNPHLLVTYKSEFRNVGPVALFDTSIAKPIDRKEIEDRSEPRDRVIDFGVLSRKEAHAIARCYGAKIRET